MSDDRLHREQQAWLERHTKDADLLVCDTRIGQCTEAIYYSPMKKADDSQKAHLKAFFQAVADEEARRGGPDDYKGSRVTAAAASDSRTRRAR